MAYLLLLFINKHLAFFFSYWKFGASLHQAGIWKEGSGSEPESYWTGANEWILFPFRRGICEYLKMLVHLFSNLCMHACTHEWAHATVRTITYTSWEVRGQLGVVDFSPSVCGSWDRTQLVCHGGRHLYPMSYFTISHDKEFCLENFSVLKQERHKGAGIFLLFSQVLFKCQE